MWQIHSAEFLKQEHAIGPVRRLLTKPLLHRGGSSFPPFESRGGTMLGMVLCDF